MKKLLNLDKSNFLYGMLIAVLCGIVFTACQKNNAKPAAPPVQPAPINTGPTLTAQEQQLVGYWILDSSIMYQNTIRTVLYSNNTNSVSCKLDLKSTYFLNQSTQGDNKDCYLGIDCSVTNQAWKAPDQGYIHLAGIVHPITLLTSTKLYIIRGIGLGIEQRYYLHK